MTTTNTHSRLACPELIGWRGEQPVLLGNRCSHCGERYFPAARGCTRCCGSELAACELGHQGRLWSWTVQSFCPKPPYDGSDAEGDFRPYGVGYIELDNGVKVQSRLSLADPQRLAIGMPMALVLEAYRRGAEGPVHTYAFAPAESLR